MMTALKLPSADSEGAKCPRLLYQSQCESSVDFGLSGDEVWSRGRRLSSERDGRRFPQRVLAKWAQRGMYTKSEAVVVGCLRRIAHDAHAP